jgi:uncharacterized protein YcfL
MGENILKKIISIVSMLFLASCSMNQKTINSTSNLFETRAKGIAVIVEGAYLAESIKIENLSTKNRGDLKEVVCKVKNVSENELGISYKYVWRKKGYVEGLDYGPWMSLDISPDKSKSLRAIGQTKFGYISAIYIR